MPAKTKVTKEMIIDAAFAVARETGAENINARTVSGKLAAMIPDELPKDIRAIYDSSHKE